MKTLTLLLVCLSVNLSSYCQKKSDWQKLFNGKDLNEWTVKIHHHEVEDNYKNTFRVEDKIIKVRYDQYETFNDRFGHLYFKTPYSYYKLSLEYRFTGIWRQDAPIYTKLNSGVMFHAQDPKTILKEQDWPISVEMQFLADLKDGKPRPTGNMCSPGTDVFFEGKIDPRHCIDSKSKTYTEGQWIKAELIVLGDSLVTHLINGEQVLQYSLPQIGGGVANRFDPNYKVDGSRLTSGYIALQSEGQEIDFRNIKLLDFEGCMNKSNKAYKPYFIKHNPSKCN